MSLMGLLCCDDIQLPDDLTGCDTSLEISDDCLQQLVTEPADTNCNQSENIKVLYDMVSQTVTHESPLPGDAKG